MNPQKFTTIKAILIAFVLTITASQLYAQTTNGIFFQAVARDNFSNPAKDRKIYVQSNIIQTTPTGTKVLTEEHQANTDATGVFSISLGNGVRVGGTASSLTTIDWSKGPYYLNLKVAITPIGGNSNWNYTKEWVDMGTTSFGAVPFALYSASSAKVDDKLNVSDTTTMLKVYAKAIKVQSLETAVASKLTAADTLTMLAPYAKAAYTIDSSFFKSQLATKLSLTDTIKYTKQKYTDSAFSKKLNIADSSIYVTPTKLAAKTFDQTPITNAIATKLNSADTIYYTKQKYSDSAFAKKLNIADSAIYVTKTQLASYNFASSGTSTTTTSVTMDTTSLSNRINLKANTTDLTALNTNIASNTASITVNATAINLKAPIASPLFTGTVGIGTTNPSSAAALDITSTTQGLLLPRLTYVQKTAISNPVAGLILFCSDCGTSGEMQLYNGTSFVNMIGGAAQFALPVISSTTGAYSITTSAAMSGGEITSDGGASITARGIVWGTSTGPTIALATKTTDGTGTGTYSSSITGLTSGVTYYLRAYATNSIGTKYGAEITLNTAQAVATLAATTPVSDIGSTTATSGGNITYNGGATVTVSGIVWSTTSTPTIALATKTTNGAANGTYTSTITGLTPGAFYYVRSYATNSVGTSYGAQTSFTTLNTATISATSSATSITSSTATTGGTITADGGATVTSRGVVYGTSSGSATYSATSGTGTGTYTSSLTGLNPATTYFVRSFATNSVGTVYGTETSFSTIAIAPTLTTTAASSITKYAASAGGTITSNGGSVITASGICWSTTATPTTSDFKTTDGTTSGTFTSSITGLTAGTTYYIRAYATNAIGTDYGATQSFTTLSSSSNNPVLASTTTATSITANSAILGGNVTDEGATEVSVRGLVYGTSTGSSTYSITVGSGAGTFTSTLTGLTQGATYFVRSFATNVQGTSYGAETSFTTQTIATLSATATPTSITTTSAISGGTISSTGGATITTSGLVWGANANPEITLTTKTTDGSTSGTFTSSITGLTQGATYHVRAYATNYLGTSYGPGITFTTITTPTVSATASGSAITGSTAISGGTITADGGAEVTARGVVYGTSSGASTYSVTTGTGTGTYTSSLTGLTPATTYYVRSFATNSVGTVYGTETSFTTNAIAPTLTTTAASSITKYAASAGGTITSNGGSAITASGICWSTTATPTTANSKTTDGTTSGTYTSSITGLTAGTVYYVRAYATNAIGTSYGAAQSFTTLSTSSNNPVLASTTSATSITANSAMLGGNVTDEGATEVSVRGLVYGTTTGSSTFSVTLGSGTGTFTSTLTGLTQGTTYFVRSFATNVQGTSYGAETSFTTQTTPTLSATTAASSIGTTTATSGGTITYNGGATITTSGLVWGANANPEITLATKTTDGTTSGTFTSSITGLTQGTTYHVRAYATNYLGTSYGPDITFTTLTTPTVSSTATVTSITGTTATGGGTISSDGGAAVTARGVVYGTTTGSATFSVSSGTGTGTYTSSLTGLTPATTYYVRSFATNSVGTVYGTETSFTTSAGPASKAMITTEPSGAAAGTAFTTQPVVRITDLSGNTVTTSTVNVVASIASGTGTLGGTTTVAAVNGVATFTNLVISGASGNFTLAFTPTSLTAATSNSFALSFGTASKAMITTHPSGAVNGVALTTQPLIRITDASGNTVTSSTVNVVASIGSGTGTLGGTTTVAAVNGVATFTNLVLSGSPGSFTVTFTPTSLTAATSNSFALSVGAASMATITTQPASAFNGIEFSTQPIVKITDAGGNTITSSTANVVASIASGSGTLGGTTAVNAVAGVANFTNLKITGTGNHTLTFTPAGGLTAATSNTLNVAQLGCAQGGSCAIGETGPGGGKVFYYSAAGFSCGPDFSSTCHYLEVAPNTWSGSTTDPLLRWDYTAWSDENHANYPSNANPHLLTTEIGLGYKNSNYLFTYYGNNSGYAAGAARRYAGGGKSDWYLGSAVEMNLLAYWSKGQTAPNPLGIASGAMIQGNFESISGAYWTSSQAIPSEYFDARKQTFGTTASPGPDHKSFERFVRPIRAF